MSAATMAILQVTDKSTKTAATATMRANSMTIKMSMLKVLPITIVMSMLEVQAETTTARTSARQPTKH